MPNSVFLGWDEPFLEPLVEWLLERREEFPGMRVVVPTAQSGRRLRETLAEKGGALLAPEVTTPGALLAGAAENVAPDWVERVAWAEVLEGIVDWSPFSELFPEKPGEGKGWAAGLADELSRLRRTLQENGHLMQTAARAMRETPEEERWAALAELEVRVESVLAKWRWKSRSRVLAGGVDLGGISRIVLAGVPEMPPLLGRALAEWKGSVDVLVGAPEGLVAKFSELGTPLVDWNDVKIGWPEGAAGSVRLAADPRQQAQEALRAVAEGGMDSPEVALGSADAETGAELQRTFTRAGWEAFHPQALQVSSGLARWFSVWTEWMARPTLEVFADLLTLPETVALVGGNLHKRARRLSRLRDEWMCMDGADLRRRVDAGDFRDEESAEDARQLLAAVENLEGVRLSLQGRDMAGALRRLVETIGRRHEAAADQAVEMMGWLDEAAAMIASLDRGAVYWIHLMLGTLPSPVASPPDGRVIDVQGWLELFHEPGRHLVLCGLNEGSLPSRGGGEPWIAEPTRKRLGLITDEQRSARDAFLLTSMIEARKAGGRVDLICGKTGAGGETLLPSRFLLAAEGADLPGRVKWLFRELEPPEAGLRWHADWQWQPRAVEPPKSLHVTSFRDYLQCPFRYYLKHVLRMKRPDPGRAEWNPRDFGNVTHFILETWGRDEEAREFTKAEAIGAYFIDLLDKSVAKQFGKQVPLAVRIQAESMRARLLWLAKKQACERMDGWRVTEVERSVSFPIGGVEVRAKIDRIDRHADGRVRIIDYKTGAIDGVDKAHRTKVTAALVAPEHLGEEGPAFYLTNEGKKTERFLWRDLQLPLYAAALVKELGMMPEPAYFAIGSTEADAGLQQWASFSETDLDAAVVCAEWVVGRISSGVFWPPSERMKYDDYAVLGAGRSLVEMVLEPG